MGNSKWFFSMSGVILLIGALAIGGKGLNFGIDFESGTRITPASSSRPNEDDVRSLLQPPASRRQDPEGRQQGAREQRLPDLHRAAAAERGAATSEPTLDERFGVGDNFSNDSIGPTFGQTVAKSAIIAIIASLLVISSTSRCASNGSTPCRCSSR